MPLPSGVLAYSNILTDNLLWPSVHVDMTSHTNAARSIVYFVSGHNCILKHIQLGYRKMWQQLHVSIYILMLKRCGIQDLSISSFIFWTLTWRTTFSPSFNIFCEFFKTFSLLRTVHFHKLKGISYSRDDNFCSFIIWIFKNWRYSEAARRWVEEDDMQCKTQLCQLNFRGFSARIKVQKLVDQAITPGVKRPRKQRLSYKIIF